MRDYLLLTNGVVVFGIENGDAPASLTDSLLRFLSPYFWQIGAADGTPHFTLCMQGFSGIPAAWRQGPGREIVVRQSTAAIFNLRGWEIEAPAGEQIVIDDVFETAYHIIAGRSHVTFYGSELSLIHLYELVRYVSLLIEEAHGSMLLHAAATMKDDSCYLVSGAKGAGKTTTMLHLVCDHGHQYFSGDKVLVTSDAKGLLIRGWPDYPHVGMGTFQRFPSLAKKCSVELTGPDGRYKPLSQKVLVEPLLFRRALSCTKQAATRQLSLVLFPAVSDAPTRVTRLSSAQKNAIRMEEHIEYPHQFGTVHWHTLFSSLRRTTKKNYSGLFEQLSHLTWLRVDGAGELEPSMLNNMVLAG